MVAISIPAQSRALPPLDGDHRWWVLKSAARCTEGVETTSKKSFSLLLIAIVRVDSHQVTLANWESLLVRFLWWRPKKGLPLLLGREKRGKLFVSIFRSWKLTTTLEVGQNCILGANRIKFLRQPLMACGPDFGHPCGGQMAAWLEDCKVPSNSLSG